MYGTLDSTELLTTEASNADIVLHCADCDHVAAANAIVAGLARSGRKTYLIHTSGTGVLSFPDIENNTDHSSAFPSTTATISITFASSVWRFRHAIDVI